MASTITTKQDSIDYVIEIVSSRLISTQAINFRKLRQVTLLAKEETDAKVYCDVVILAIMRYLEIGVEGMDKAGNFGNALRLFNALNLSDKKINTFFVEMILILAPEITTSLASVLSKLTEELARGNKTRYAHDRVARLEEALNRRIENNLIICEEVEEADEEVLVPRSKRVNEPRNSNRKLNLNNVLEDAERSRLVGRFGMESIKIDNDLRAARAASDRESAKSGGSNKFIPFNTINISDKQRRGSEVGTVLGGPAYHKARSETAHETHLRLSKAKGLKIRNDDDDVISPSDSASVVRGRYTREEARDNLRAAVERANSLSSW